MNRLKMARLWLVGSVLLFPASALAQFYPGFDARQPAPSFLGVRIKEHLLSAIFGALVGAFFSERLKKFRLWIFIAIIALPLIFWMFVSVEGGNVAFFIAGAVVAYMALRDKIAKELRDQQKAAKPTTFGSAEWATLEHLNKSGLIGDRGFLLGSFETYDQSYPLYYTGDRHLLTIAPTRSGKGVASIVPNLLTYEGSAIIIDPKGENARITAARRGQGDAAKGIPGMGQTVHVVDPWGITDLPAAWFNPMDWLNPDDEDINENAMMLADSIVISRKGSSDPFWDEEAKALLMGLLLYVALDEREQEDRTLGRVRDIISMGSDGLKEILLQMVESTNPIVSSTAERTMSKEEKLRSNVLAALQSHTHFLDSPRIRKSLHASSFKFEDLKTSKMTVYLVLPADRLETFGRWLRLLVQQALTVNARNIEVKPEKPILFLLDEMAALGRLTMVEQAYGLMAGFGMQLWGIVQDLSQLERIYEKGWETFIGNSGVLQYFGSRDHKTAEYFSKLCGVTTIEKFSFTNAIARAVGWSSSSSSSGSSSGSSSSVTNSNSTTQDFVQRHLAFPDELMVLRDEKQLLMVENFNPIPGKKIIWYQDRQLKILGANIQRSNPLASTNKEGASVIQEIEADLDSKIENERSVTTKSFEEAKAAMAKKVQKQGLTPSGFITSSKKKKR